MAQFDLNTRLAFDRTRVALDRTLMAWVRTALSLITFGFSVFKFFQLEAERAPAPHRLISSREFALAMVVMGLLSLLIGIVDYRRDTRSLRADYPDMPRSRTGLVAMFVAILGILALLAVVFRK